MVLEQLVFSCYIYYILSLVNFFFILFNPIFVMLWFIHCCTLQYEGVTGGRRGTLSVLGVLKYLVGVTYRTCGCYHPKVSIKMFCVADQWLHTTVCECCWREEGSLLGCCDKGALLCFDLCVITARGWNLVNPTHTLSSFQASVSQVP